MSAKGGGGGGEEVSPYAVASKRYLRHRNNNGVHVADSVLTEHTFTQRLC